MAQRAVGGGERYIEKQMVSLSGTDTAAVIVPPGADAARIQPQLVSSPLTSLLVVRGDDDATLAANELALDDREVLMDAFPAGETIRFTLIDSTGTATNGGANDRVVVVFYTNIAGRAGRKV